MSIGQLTFVGGEKRMLRKIASVLLGLTLGFGAHADVTPGEAAPAALGSDLRGHALDVPALRGKVVVLSFWATWCGYCMKEMPMLATMQNVADQKHLPLQIVLINYQEDHDVFRHTSRVLRKQAPG